MISCTRWLILFMIFLILFPLVTSQLRTYFCSNNYGNVSNESLYRHNRDDLLGSLSSQITSNGFHRASKGQVYAVALCRADIQLDECRRCVRNVSIEIQKLCPNQLQAIRWTESCMLWYSNQTTPANFTGFLSPNSCNATTCDKTFKDVRAELIDDLRVRAANGNSSSKAAFGNSSVPDFATIYAMLQCTPDLSPQSCSSCLARATRRILTCCDASSGVRVYTPSCSIRYELRPFYNITRLQKPLEPLPPLPPSAGKRDNLITSTWHIIFIIIIIISVVVCLSLALCACIFVRRRIKRMKDSLEFGEDGDEISTVESIQYDFVKIRAATNNFSDANKLGQGGFGSVYKGRLQNGREIAVKRLSKSSSQGDHEFKNEVLLMARLQHRNLVRLLGFSIKGMERLLVYEFVKNGSLEHVIFDRIKSSNLKWDARYKIIGGIARGLLYLHEDSRLRIIHRDLKTSNILLDEEMNPKISDFGMAKVVRPDATQESTSRIVGTYGYMAPEYALRGHLSIKSDVFSFGVLVLQILSGQRKIFFQNGENSSGNDLLSHAWRNWRHGESANIIDPALMATSSSARQEMVRCIHIALLCVQENPHDRPTMASVVVMLNSFSLTLPLPSEPGFYMSSSISASSFPQEYNSSQIRLSESLLLGGPAYSSSGDSPITERYKSTVIWRI